MKKIRIGNVNVCEKLLEIDIERILGKLFPRGRRINTYGRGRIVTEERIPEVTAEEIENVIKRARRKGNKAPGPDGIQARIMAEAHSCAEAMHRGLYDACLRTGKFPVKWKEAKIVLIKRDGKPDGVPSSYRPLCLINEQGTY